jgi:hypothetical protein
VQSLVDSAAAGAEAVRHDVDRDAVDSNRDQRRPLPLGEGVVDPAPDRRQQLLPLRFLLGRRRAVVEEGPALGLERNLAPLPRATSQLRRRLEQSELVGPGREAALAAEVVEFPEHRHQRVVGALERDVVEVAAPEVWERRPAPSDLEPRRPQQQLVELGDRLVPDGALRAKAGDPGLALGSRRPRPGRCAGAALALH